MPSVLIVGGSIGGLSSGLALLKAGFADVQVFERSPEPLTRGTGVGLDDVSLSILWELLDGTPSGGAALLSKLAPMGLTEERQAVTGNVLMRLEYPYHAVYWEEIYKLLLEGYQAAGGRIKFGAKAAGITIGEEGNPADPPVRVLFDDGSVIDGDLLIAADGPRSKSYPQIAPMGVPPKPMQYRGYTAIRGTLPRSAMPEAEQQQLMRELPDLGNCLYFVMGPVGHLVLYELGGGLLNWLMYINQPEPTFKDTAQTTGAPPPDFLADFYSTAETRWGPSIAWLLRNTPEPFVNDIYDRDPLPGLVRGHAALLGDAGHPITPHVAKGTCLAIHDAYALGKALQPAAANPGLIPEALSRYEQQRLPEVTRMVLVSRHIGLVRNRLAGVCSQLTDFSAVAAEQYSEMVASAGLNTDTIPLDPVLREIGSKAPRPDGLTSQQ